MPHRDQVLTQHLVSGRSYELSGLRTGSIRDQLLRGQLLVERLKAAGEIGPRADGGEDLLVVGGGAAGISAALTASAMGIDVAVLERQRLPFATQLRAVSRWIDPGEFDWPQPHFRDGSYPFASLAARPFVFPFQADYARRLARTWNRHFFAVLKAFDPTKNKAVGRIDLLKVNVQPLPTASKLTIQARESDVIVYPWFSDGSARQFGAAIACIGIGKERTKLPGPGKPDSFDGFGFWASDPIEQPNLGVAPRTGTLRAVVSGGGDGALQDVQRILTGTFGRRLLHKFGAYLDGSDALRAVLPSLMNADDVARREHAWAVQRGQPLNVYKRWHDAYLNAVDNIAASWDRTAVQHLTQHVLRADATVELTLVLDAPHLGFSYPLNRLLALLVMRLHSLEHGRPFIRTTQTDFLHVPQRPVVCINMRIDSIAGPAGHQCGDPWKCHGLSHQISVQDLDDGAKVKALGDFDVVVVRHGLDSRPFFGRPPIPEQIVPFALPDL